MDFEFILHEKSESATTITLNRTAELNALVHKMIREIHAALDDAGQDDAP